MMTRKTYGATSLTPLKFRYVLANPSDRFSRIPMSIPEIAIDWAPCWLKAAARMAPPALEYLKKTEKTARRTTERTKHHTNSREMGSPAISTISWGNHFGSQKRASLPPE